MPRDQFPFTVAPRGAVLKMMSTAQDAAETVRIVRAYVGGPTEELAIADAYACLGGNTSAFSDAFGRVRAFEIDADRRAQLLANIGRNVGGFYTKNNVSVGADCRDPAAGVAAQTQDAVFLDPPWRCACHCEIDNCMFGELIGACRALAATRSARFVFLKLPAEENYPALRPGLRRLSEYLATEWADVQTHPIARRSPRSSYHIVCARAAHDTPHA
jgi:hypothetical protein